MKRQFMLIYVSLFFAAVAFSASTSDANAQFRVGPHVGYTFDGEAVFIGADAWVGVTSLSDTIQLHLNPEFSYYLLEGDNVSLWSIDLNTPFLFNVGMDRILRPYAAPGVSIRRASVEILGETSSDTDVGFNLIGGALFRPDERLQPFAQARVGIQDGTDFQLMGGVLFEL